MDDDRQSAGGHRAWAHLRFSIVGALLAAPPPDGELGAEIRALSERTWRHPSDPEREVRFGFSTIERWYYDARAAADPVGALVRQVRSDAGKEKAISAELLGELGKQYGLHPSWSYKLHADNIAVVASADPAKYGTVPSYPTVRKAMKRRAWTKRSVPRHPTPGQLRSLHRREHRETRSYEAPAVHALWHLDFHQGRHRIVDTAGNCHTPYALAILDDRSRLCCHIQWYLAESAENLVHGLVQAFCKRGLPRAIMHDNGSAMRAAETQNGITDSGSLPEPTLEYSPDQNGKQEVFWGTVEGRLGKMVERIEALSLDFLNRATAAWVEGDYNHRKHEEIDTTPVQRMLAGPDVSRKAPPIDVLRRRFTREVKRTQRKSDGTVSIAGVRFEIPSRLRTLDTPTLRYAEWDLSSAWVVDPRTHDVLAAIRPLDKARNASGIRRALQSVSEVAVPPPSPDADPIPPLLRKLLAEYAATGLPPAYLPKDEVALRDEEDDRA